MHRLCWAQAQTCRSPSVWSPGKVCRPSRQHAAPGYLATILCCQTQLVQQSMLLLLQQHARHRRRGAVRAQQHSSRQATLTSCTAAAAGTAALSHRGLEQQLQDPCAAAAAMLQRASSSSSTLRQRRQQNSCGRDPHRQPQGSGAAAAASFTQVPTGPAAVAAGSSMSTHALQGVLLVPARVMLLLACTQNASTVQRLAPAAQ